MRKQYNLLVVIGLVVLMSFSKTKGNAIAPIDLLSYEVDTVYLDIDSTTHVEQAIFSDSSLILMGSYGDAAMLTLNFVSDIASGSYVLDTTYNGPFMLYFDAPDERPGKSVNGFITIAMHDTVAKHIQGTFSGQIVFNESNRVRNISNGQFNMHY